jgi:hypothetical protein
MFPNLSEDALSVKNLPASNQEDSSGFLPHYLFANVSHLEFSLLEGIENDHCTRSNTAVIYFPRRKYIHIGCGKTYFISKCTAQQFDWGGGCTRTLVQQLNTTFTITCSLCWKLDPAKVRPKMWRSCPFPGCIFNCQISTADPRGEWGDGRGLWGLLDIST